MSYSKRREPQPMPWDDFEFTVIVSTGDYEKAVEVMKERIYFDEDYGFEYQICFTRKREAPREEKE